MDHISWNLKLTVNSGKLEAFRALMTEMVADTKQNEAGCLTYDWYVMADGSEVHIQERYADNGAALTHLGNSAPSTPSASWPLSHRCPSSSMAPPTTTSAAHSLPWAPCSWGILVDSSADRPA